MNQAVRGAGPRPARPTRVYLDARSLLERGPDESNGDRLRPEARQAIHYLREGHHPIELVGDAGTLATVRRLLGRETPDVVVDLPSDASGWLVTDEPGLCAEVRDRRRLQTLLVGPGGPDRGLAFRPSDRRARDLVDAAITILTAEAMGDAASQPG